MRLFIAIWPSAGVNRKISEFINQTQQTYPNLERWIRAEQIHLTVAFLGDVAEAAIPALKNKLATVAKNIPPFTLTASGFAWLPAHQPRLGLITVTNNTTFKKLQNYLTTAAHRLKIQSLNQPPHLTIIRCSRRLSSLPTLTFAPCHFAVSRIELISSVLTPQGPIYTCLKAFKLRYGADSGLFRPNIAFCIVNAANELLLVKQPLSTSPYWQLPQGGVKVGETAAATVRRELGEELGLKKFSLLLIKNSRLRYRWPLPLQLQGNVQEKSKYIGQEQDLAIIKIDERRINLQPDLGEIGAVCWVKSHDFINQLQPRRRRLGKLVLAELARLGIASP